MIEYSTNTLLRILEESFLLFMYHIHKIPLSPFKNFNEIFAWKEHQTKKVNLSNAYIMIIFEW